MSQVNPQQSAKINYNRITGGFQAIVQSTIANSTITFNLFDGRQSTVPFLAPPRPPYLFVGFDELLHKLKQRLLAGENSALQGSPGVGKTALAVALAHDSEVLELFPDGVLWAALGRQVDIFSQLGIWGMALGISQSEMEKLTDPESRQQRIQALIGRHKMLLIADDARHIEVAQHFKVGGPNCAFVVTTRMPEVAAHFAGNETTVMHGLSEDDGLMLLRQLAPALVDLEEARELVKVVGGLPLALILMGQYLHVQTLSGQPRRLRGALEQLYQAMEHSELDESEAEQGCHPDLVDIIPLWLQTMIAISDEDFE